MRPWKHDHPASSLTLKPLCPAHNCLSTGGQRQTWKLLVAFKWKVPSQSLPWWLQSPGKVSTLQMYQVVCQWLPHVGKFLLDYITQEAQFYSFRCFLFPPTFGSTQIVNTHPFQLFVQHWGHYKYVLENDSKWFSGSYPLFFFYHMKTTLLIEQIVFLFN